MSAAGYVSCSCTTCFEIAIASEGESMPMCHACDDAGCDGEHECSCDVVDDLDEDDVEALEREEAEARAEADYRERERAMFDATKKVSGW